MFNNIKCTWSAKLSIDLFRKNKSIVGRSLIYRFYIQWFLLKSFPPMSLNRPSFVRSLTTTKQRWWRWTSTWMAPCVCAKPTKSRDGASSVALNLRFLSSPPHRNHCVFFTTISLEFSFWYDISVFRLNLSCFTPLANSYPQWDRQSFRAPKGLLFEHNFADLQVSFLCVLIIEIASFWVFILPNFFPHKK